MDYTNHPSYQRMMQKLHSIRPEQRAILNTLSVDAQFADAETRNALATAAQVNNKNYANASLGLRTRALNTDTGLRRRQFENEQEQNKMATGLGIGQVLVEADYGKRRDAIDLATFKDKRDFANRLKQLYGGAT